MRIYHKIVYHKLLRNNFPILILFYSLINNLLIILLPIIVSGTQNAKELI